MSIVAEIGNISKVSPERKEQRMKKENTETKIAREAWITKAGRGAVLCAALGALTLAGCTSGTLTGIKQNCQSSGGLLSTDKISCSGSASTAKGQPSLDIIDTDGDLSGTYRLQASISIGEGTTKASVTAADGKQTGGTISPGKPLELDGIVSLDEDDEEVSLALKTKGKTVKDIVYEATLTPAN